MHTKHWGWNLFPIAVMILPWMEHDNHGKHCYNDEREVNAPIMMIMTMVMIMMMMMMVMTWMSEAQTKHWYLAGGSSEHEKHFGLSIK